MAGTQRAVTTMAAFGATAVLLAGCTSLIPRITVTVVPSTNPASASASASESATAPVPPASTPLEPSSAAIEYAESLGGTSHSGEDLYLVLGGTFASEKAAQAALDEALPRFGDMQAYFIVQTGDNFDGLTAGTWVVIEAYHDQPPDEQLQFDRRGFPKATVVQATADTEDPIPVVEDVAG